MSAELTPEQAERYRRHIIFSEIGEEGQKRLLSSSALVVGVGGLGSPAALYLASCGVGRIGLLDPDNLELSNLHRQVLYSSEELGMPKASSASKRLSSLNPGIRIEAHVARLGPDNIGGMIGDYDVILECTDNFGSKYLANDACVRSGKPLVMGGIYRFEGQVTVVVPGKGPCFRCIFPEPPASGVMLPPEEAGLLGSVPGVIGAIQATEAIKLLAGIGEPLSGRLLRYNAKLGDFSVSRFGKDMNCPACGRR